MRHVRSKLGDTPQKHLDHQSVLSLYCRDQPLAGPPSGSKLGSFLLETLKTAVVVVVVVVATPVIVTEVLETRVSALNVEHPLA